MERSRCRSPFAPDRIPPRCRRFLPALAVALLVACSGDDLTGPSVADELLTGRRLAVSADNGKDFLAGAQWISAGAATELNALIGPC